MAKKAKAKPAAANKVQDISEVTPAVRDAAIGILEDLSTTTGTGIELSWGMISCETPEDAAEKQTAVVTRVVSAKDQQEGEIALSDETREALRKAYLANVGKGTNELIQFMLTLTVRKGFARKEMSFANVVYAP